MRRFVSSDLDVCPLRRQNANDARLLKHEPTGVIHVPGLRTRFSALKLRAAALACDTLSDIRAAISVAVQHIPGSFCVLERSL
jgi:hypothetical protein